MKQISDFIRRYCAPPDDELEDLLQKMTLRTLAPGEHFCSIGQTHYEIAFILSGAMRVYFLSPEGADTTIDFLFPEEVVAPLYGASARLPSPSGIEAMSECRLAVWHYSVRDELTAKDGDQWTRLITALVEESFRRKWQHALALQSGDATERYRAALKLFPEAFRSVRQYYVASYLGVTPQHLSRIRKQAEK